MLCSVCMNKLMGFFVPIGLIIFIIVIVMVVMKAMGCDLRNL